MSTDKMIIVEDIPPMLKKLLTIPPNAVNHLVAPNIPVSTIAKRPRIPAVPRSSILAALGPAQLFTADGIETEVDVTKLPRPPTTLLKTYRESVDSAFSDGAKSVSCIDGEGKTRRVPFWAIPYWTAQAELQDGVNSWSKGFKIHM